MKRSRFLLLPKRFAKIRAIQRGCASYKRAGTNCADAQSVPAQGMIEFALILPLLLVLIYGVIETGHLLFVYSATMTSSREAARYGSAAGDIGDASKTPRYQDCAGITNAAIRLGSLAGIQSGDISIRYDDGDLGSYIGTSCFNTSRPVTLGDRIEVQVVANYQPFVPLVNFPPLPISSTTRRTIIKDVRVQGPPPGVTPTVKFATFTSDVLEDYGTLKVRVQIDVTSSADITVPFAVQSGSSATQGSDLSITGVDYLIKSIPVTIPAGKTSVDIEIVIKDDSIFEPDETIILQLSKPANANLDPIPANTKHTVTIRDNDPEPLVFFEPLSQSLEEGQTGSVLIKLSNPTQQNVTAWFAANGSGTSAASDYTLSASPVTILKYATEAFVSIAAKDDNIDEDDETLVLELTSVSAGSSIDGARSKHTATIIDMDTAKVFFSFASQSAGEDAGHLVVEAQLDMPSSKNVTVPFTVGGTATAGTDYNLSPNPNQITFPAGATKNSSIIIEILQDLDDEEEDETIIISLNPTPGTVSKGVPDVHTATITKLGSQPPVVSFSAASQSVDEKFGKVTLLVRLSAPYSQNVSVPFTVSGTAQGSGIDYSITASPVVIPAGSSSTTIEITVNDDNRDEDAETVTVTMGTPTNAVKGSPSVYTLTIQDNDLPPTVAFQTNGMTVKEDIGTVSVNLVLSAATSKDIVVPFTVSGTAGDGTDYTLSPPDAVLIPAGSTSAVIQINVIDDQVKEDDKSLVLTMDTPTNATKGTPDSFTLTIQDDNDCRFYNLKYTTVNNGTKKINTYLENSSSTQNVTIASISIFWSGNAYLNSIQYKNASIWPQTPQSIAPPTAFINGGWVTGSDLTLSAGSLNEPVVFFFSGGSLQTPVGISVTFSNGCSAKYP